ncbi:hypothetical protein ABLN67_13280 [Mycobacterium tuberculosis]
MFNHFIYRRNGVFRIYRETLSRFSCAASRDARIATATKLAITIRYADPSHRHDFAFP